MANGVKIAVLDDYVHFAEGAADWGSLPGAQVDFFYDILLNQDALVKRLAPYEALSRPASGPASRVESLSDCQTCV